MDLSGLKNTEASKLEIRAAELVKRHNNLIDCGQMLEKTFTPSFLNNFLLSSVIVCLTAFQYSTLTDTIQSIFNSSYCTAMLNQILLLCYFGQKVVDSSESIAGGAYESGWELIENKKVKKAVRMIICRAQTPSRLTAMKFAEISLPSFTSVELLAFN